MCVSVCVSGAARVGGAPAFRQEAEGPCELANRSLGVQPADRQLEPQTATAPLQDMAASRGVLRGGASVSANPRQHSAVDGRYGSPLRHPCTGWPASDPPQAAQRRR